MAVRLPSAEEPDWGCGLGNLKGEDTNLTAGGIIRHERRGEAVLLCDSVELLCAWVGKGALGNGMVATTELEIDHITDGGGDYLRVKDESSGTVGFGTDSDGDISGESGNNTSENGDSSSSELHVWIRLESE